MLLKGIRPRGITSTSVSSQAASIYVWLILVIASFIYISTYLPSTHGSSIRSSFGNSQSLGSPRNHWVATWTTAPQGCPPERVPDSFFKDGLAFHNTTIRQTIRVTLGGDEIRVQLSNTFSSSPLRIDEANVARPSREEVSGEMTLAGSPGIDSTTIQRLTFGGINHTTIPPGGLVLSDPVQLPVDDGDILAISAFLASGQETNVVNCHWFSLTHSWLTKGNEAATPILKRANAEHPTSWYFISAVEVLKPSDHGTVVLLGDSITDISRALVNSNARWSDHLFDRLRSNSISTLSIVNQAIGGNQLLDDGVAPNLNARLDRDALAVSGIKYAVIVEGIIDAGAGRDSREAFFQLQQAVARFHAAEIPVFGATLSPFSCRDAPVPWKGANLPLSEQQRLKLNELIRNENLYDVVIDFDAALRDPHNTTETLLEYMGSDCLHPAPAGFDAMVRAFPIDAFERFKDGVGMAK